MPRISGRPATDFRTRRTKSVIPHPRIGFFGVIDERLDRDLVAEVARQRPDWQLILVGPVVKIDPESLPRAPNIHYLGGKKYDDLPRYIANWDAAMMPFARNEATRFISPTKTPEYLAAGKTAGLDPDHRCRARLGAPRSGADCRDAGPIRQRSRIRPVAFGSRTRLASGRRSRTRADFVGSDLGANDRTDRDTLRRRETGATAVAPYSAVPVKEPAVQSENGDARV